MPDWFHVIGTDRAKLYKIVSSSHAAEQTEEDLILTFHIRLIIFSQANEQSSMINPSMIHKTSLGDCDCVTYTWTPSIHRRL